MQQITSKESMLLAKLKIPKSFKTIARLFRLKDKNLIDLDDLPFVFEIIESFEAGLANLK